MAPDGHHYLHALKQERCSGSAVAISGLTTRWHEALCSVQYTNRQLISVCVCAADPAGGADGVLPEGRGHPGEDHRHRRLLLLQPPLQTHHTLSW